MLRMNEVKDVLSAHGIIIDDDKAVELVECLRPEDNGQSEYYYNWSWSKGKHYVCDLPETLGYMIGVSYHDAESGWIVKFTEDGKTHIQVWYTGVYIDADLNVHMYIKDYYKSEIYKDKKLSELYCPRRKPLAEDNLPF